MVQDQMSENEIIYLLAVCVVGFFGSLFVDWIDRVTNSVKTKKNISN